MPNRKTLDRIGVRRIQSAAGVTEYQLKSNGLSILLKEDQSTPAVTFMVAYRCGSRNEGAGTTGSAHFFEHLMFKGTPRFDPLEGNGVMEIFGRVGAQLNANTGYDLTRYFEVVPSEHLELCIRVEADRMRNLKNRKSDRDSEMTVVRNEFERNENEPSSALFKEVMAAAFKDHPYHHPVIGARSDVEGIPMQRMVEFYDQFYWPNNATVLVVGKFDSEQALAWISKYFGRIPRSPKAIPVMYTTEPQQEGERRVEVRRAGSLPQLLAAFHIPAASHPDIPALSALAMILGNHTKPSSPLYKAVVETGKANSVGAFAYDLRDPSVFMLTASLTPGTELSEVESLLFAELEKLANQPVSAEELARVKSANRIGTIIQLDDPMQYANLLSSAVGVDTWKWSVEYDDKFDAVTPADIQRVARTYFSRDNRTVGHFIPSPGSRKPAPGEQPKPRKNQPTRRRREPIHAVPQRTNFAERTVREVLPNGLTVCVIQRGKGAIAVNTAVPAGENFAAPGQSLVPEIAASMLTAGTARFSKEEIGSAMEEMGGPLSFRTSAYAVKSGKVIAAADFDRYLEMLSDVLRNPTLADEELRKRLPRYKANVMRLLQDTHAQADNAFDRAIYPAGHPYHPEPLEEILNAVDTLNAADLQAFHKGHYTPDGSVITIVGDIDPQVALAAVRKHFGSWSGAARKDINVPAVNGPVSSADQPREVLVPLADKANVDIIIGHATNLNRLGTDYFAARIANNALGQSTIADRLGKVIRAQHGLTYGVTSHFGDTSYGAASWQIGISVAPENIGKARELINQVVGEYLRDGITPEELEDKKQAACGSMLVQMRSSAGIGQWLCEAEFLGYGASGLDAMVDGYMNVTKADVDAAIRRYFDLSQSVTVISGTVGQ